MTNVAAAVSPAIEQDQEVMFSSNVGIRINNNDLILTNPFIAETIEASEEGQISYEDDHILLVVKANEFAHFLHLVYEYSSKNILVILDGTFDFADVSESGDAIKCRSQLMTITETNFNK